MAQIEFNRTVAADRFYAASLKASDTAVFRNLGSGDTAIGGAGNDRLSLTSKGSTADLGGGNDQISITLETHLVDSRGVAISSARDTIDGGSGTDQLVIAAGSNQLTDTVRAELARLAVHVGSTPGGHFVSDILHLDMTNVENASVRLDGVLKAAAELVNGPPAAADSYAGTEDTVLVVDAAQGLLANDGSAGGTLRAIAGSFATTLGSSVSIAADGGFSYRGAANANGADSFSYTVTDQLGHGATATATIAVAAVNDAPQVTSGGTANLAENGTSPAYQASATDVDAGTTLTWSLTGADAALFDIDAATGAVTCKATPDYEVPADAGGDNTYDITVTASDGSLKASKAVAITVTVTDVNEAPVITSAGTVSFAENATGTVYAATGSDPEGAALSWSLGGADAALFAINAATGVVSFKAAPDFEAPADAGADNVYDITVIASDGAVTP